jgi:hypothetical protein
MNGLGCGSAANLVGIDGDLMAPPAQTLGRENQVAFGSSALGVKAARQQSYSHPDRAFAGRAKASCGRLFPVLFFCRGCEVGK